RVELPDPWKYLPIYALVEDAEGGIWMGSRKGQLFRWDGNKKVEKATIPSVLANKPVISLVRGPGGTLWALFPQALLHQDGHGGWQTYHLPPLPAHASLPALSFSPEGEMLLAMGLDGLLIIDAQGHSRTLTAKDGMPLDGVMTAIRDRRGVLWIGSNGSDALAQTIPGLRVLDTDPQTGIGLGLGSVLAFFELSPGKIMLGGSRGLQIWEEGLGITNRWKSFPGLAMVEVWALLAHPQGGVWVGTTRGLWHWKDGQILAGPKQLKNAEISSLLLHANRLWVCTREGLAELTAEGKFIAFHALPQETGKPNVVKVLPQDGPTGPGLLVATDVGLYNFQIGNKRPFDRAFANTPVHVAAVTTMHEETSGKLWISSSQGLHEFTGKPNEWKWKHFGAIEAGILGTTSWIRRLPAGQLAVGHAKGIAIVSDGRVVQLTKNRGLLSDETTIDAVLLDSRGWLWIGMKGGACILDTRRPFPEV
ncbi:MAG: hypothetical protein Q8O00_01640, partial [Holophaga sp.]|nr:hypothetical protein [Holophaga sp.]